MDKSQQEIDSLHPKVKEDCREAWAEAQATMPANVQIYISQGYRTFTESDALYAEGRTAKGDIVTNAKAGQSYHNYGLAIDFAMLTNGKEDWVVGPNWMKVVNIFKKHGWTWGGDWKGTFQDRPHLEKKFGYSVTALRALHDAGKFIQGTTFVNI